MMEPNEGKVLSIEQGVTERARKVILSAQEQAEVMGASQVDPEHSLLGLLSESEGVGAKILTTLTLSNLRVALGSKMRPPSAVFISTESKLSPRAKRVLELAADEARRMGFNHVDTGHLLIGLLLEGEGAAVQVLSQFGFDLEKTRGKLKDFLGQV